jgi:hypothetical protein
LITLPHTFYMSSPSKTCRSCRLHNWWRQYVPPKLWFKITVALTVIKPSTRIRRKLLFHLKVINWEPFRYLQVSTLTSKEYKVSRLTVITVKNYRHWKTVYHFDCRVKGRYFIVPCKPQSPKLLNCVTMVTVISNNLRITYVLRMTFNVAFCAFCSV